MRVFTDVILESHRNLFVPRIVGGLVLVVLTVCTIGCSGDANGEYQSFKDIEDEKEPATEVSEPVVAVDPESQPTDAGEQPIASEPDVVESVPIDDGNERELASDSDEASSAEEQAKVLSSEDEKVATATQTEPKTIELLVPDKSFVRDRQTNAVRVSYDDIDLLRVLNMEPVPANADEYFPDWLSGLDGKRIRLRGFMYPTFTNTGLTGFLFARDNDICCFGKDPKIYDLFVVKLDEGETTDYIQGRPFDVVGTFHIEPEVDDGELLQLYRISEAKVLDD
ncbi:MAG: hypothetical protein AB8G99_15985 [Planctomycetaceae bacterium]